MKFSNGNWLNKEGYILQYPMEVYDVRKTEKDLTIYAPFDHIVHRGKTLDGGMMTIQLSSPIEDVICVKMFHHLGSNNKGPHFELNKKDVSIEIEETEDDIVFSSGSLHAKFNKKDVWNLGFYNNEKQLTSSESKAMSYILTDQKNAHMREQLSMDVGELIYGLGERFTAFVKNGQTVDIWNEDGGTGSEQAYKNIPFYMSNKGYGVFVNHPEKVSFEVGSEKVSKLQFSVEGECLEYYIINGPTMKDVLGKYTTLTGKPSLPPAWTFGLWLSTSFTTNYNEETVNSFIDGMIERDIPLDVFHFDCFWMKEFEWCNFEWDNRVFPNPETMLKRLKDKGLKICLWINPYIGQKSQLFTEGMEKGYLLKRPDGSVWQWDKWQAGQGIVDFTNPDACRWFEEKLEALIDMGVDSFKTDFGERIPTDVVYFDGSDPMKMHNYYTYLYNEVVFKLLERKFGKDQAAVFARSATVGSQKFPVHWGGDCWSTYPSMAESLRGGLSFSLSGFSYWSHDISGFEHGTTPDLYKRWTQFGLLSSHSRYHGNTEYKVPWIYDDEAVDVTRAFTKLKNSLMPYLYRNACESAQTGVPMMRPMVLEFPDDETCHYLDRQYMFGDSLLVAPIFNEKGIVKYYLPDGKWTNFLTNEAIQGEKWHTEEHGYMSLPFMARENSIIPVGAIDSKAEYDYADGVTFHVFELADGKGTAADIYNIHGEKAGSVTAIKEGSKISFRANNMPDSYSILLRNVEKVDSVSNGKMTYTEQGTLITTKDEAVQIHLSE
ncbi:alpha-xylosidase [Bacillus sp. CMF21]|uniref:alpha-xylosidase n=1 Tax=Metabacillus dongyingensis TaxID=2874282 RepID=UPI001CBC54F7|nr:alpha-xylosidase [Metabacillus dongyingensis]UAL51678.1 alpha-xylosidase [Metabacillus dongyingensis]UOK57542.1 alpha-xylosidase [Bacillus sp. OVS6]USK27986.1 alpha-xylosidase [Bacillus sp. CMF21]